jgi:hypothetical protein
MTDLNDLPHLKDANVEKNLPKVIDITCTPFERRCHHNARVKWLKEQRENDRKETINARSKKLKIMTRREGMCIFWECEKPAKKGITMCIDHAKHYNDYQKARMKKAKRKRKR